ncbi:MAG: phosphate/phosphite/phosphonate ABC transporter substrate-binding protein [Acidobacteria bacterium]|nr:phosphate/phosphite/phosphonate ABC transporter substrate-binding protein [Acidobacteriota bacterium]
MCSARGARTAAPATGPALLLLLVLALAAVAGCGGPVPPRTPRTGQPEVLIGLAPEHNLFRQLERHEPLAAYLGRKVGARIRLKVLPQYADIVDDFAAQNLDGAFFGSFTYVLAHERHGVVVVARPEWPGNRSTYHGMVLVRRDSGIRGAADLRGKRFAFVSKATTAGYLLPLHFFANAGIADPVAFLGEAYFTGTHEDVILDVLRGRADAGAAKNTVYERLAAEDARLDRELVVLERSPEVPENALALRRDIDPRLRSALRDALLAMDADPAGRQVLADYGAVRFLATRHEDYRPVYEYAREAGLDLAHHEHHDR